ncbi:DUF3987 domain-containing protein [Methylomicrobium sp. Wu6]|uniref:DUF3987 domain-containing protein n=1 Tax=Methylomicrobium sp. Wu6 TaxID=3107928 RepID=UPI002DD61B0F|nr:DUF3987 domain-containing protein [Methylomicrobium sp. Wu6]MEC4747173.1 DUF3987 domain-containing protein [Methylomicrobium sp. Wu6]
MTDLVCTIEEYLDYTQTNGETVESNKKSATARVSDRRTTDEPKRKLCEFTYRSPDYPIGALGPLSKLCQTVAENAQLSPAMVGQSILAAASLVAQGGYEVETLSSMKPLSIFVLTVADSGDGKSTAEGIILPGIRQFEKERHDALQAKSPEDQKDEREPYLLASDATVQGIIKGFRTGWPSQGVFTAEGAALLCGWGMAAEQRANTSANLNKLWDGEPISIQSGMSGRVQLYRRRFCAHWLIQPDAAQEALTDPGLSSIGLWPRFMVSWPEPLAPRKYRQYEFWHDPIVKAFWDRCKAMLGNQRITGGECGEFRTIRLSAPARQILIETFERMEQARDSAHSLHSIKPFAVRLCELACRNAGVLAAYADENIISEERMKNGIALAGYSLDTWRGIFGQREDLTHDKWARELYTWLLKRPKQRASETDILKTAIPKHLRNKHKRDTALSILREYGMIRKAIDIVSGDIRIAHAEWEVVQDA